MQLEQVDAAEGVEQFGSEERFKRMLGSFKRHVPELLAKLRTQTGDEYAISIHTLKGCARTIYARELGERAYELEKAAKSGDWGVVKAKNEDLLKDVQRLLDDISAI